MYRRWKNYKPYRKYNKNYDGGLLGPLILTIIIVFFYIGKFIFSVIYKLFKNTSGIKKYFKINENHFIKSTPNISDNSDIGNDVDERYVLRDSLLTDAEKNFLNVLKQVVDGRYIIENQVQLSRIVTPKDQNGHFINYADFNQIKSKSIDFVLYDRNYKPHLCIELDDRSHLRLDRINRDFQVNRILKGVGLKIIHIKTSYSHDLESLRRQIFQN